jgi:hypothetical protein
VDGAGVVAGRRRKIPEKPRRPSGARVVVARRSSSAYGEEVCVIVDAVARGSVSSMLAHPEASQTSVKARLAMSCFLIKELLMSHPFSSNGCARIARPPPEGERGEGETG